MLSLLFKTIVLVLMTNSYEEKQLDNKTENECSGLCLGESTASWKTKSSYLVNVKIEEGDLLIDDIDKERKNAEQQKTDWSLVHVEEEAEGEDTPEVIDELLLSFDKFVNKLTSYKEKRLDKKFFSGYLPSFAFYVGLIQTALRAPSNKIYFSPKRKEKFFSSYYFEAAERFHEIKNKAFCFFNQKKILEEKDDCSNEEEFFGVLLIKVSNSKKQDIVIGIDEELTSFLDEYLGNEKKQKKWVAIFVKNKICLTQLKQQPPTIFERIIGMIKKIISENCLGFRIAWRKRKDKEIYFATPEAFFSCYNYDPDYFDQVLIPPMFLTNGEGKFILAKKIIDRNIRFIFGMEIDEQPKKGETKYFFLLTRMTCYDGKKLQIGREYEIVLKYDKLNIDEDKGVKWIRDSNFRISSMKDISRSCCNYIEKKRRKITISNDLILDWQKEKTPFEHFEESLERGIKTCAKIVSFEGDERELITTLEPFLFDYVSSYVFLNVKEEKNEFLLSNRPNIELFIKENSEKTVIKDVCLSEIIPDSTKLVDSIDYPTLISSREEEKKINVDDRGSEKKAVFEKTIKLHELLSKQQNWKENTSWMFKEEASFPTQNRWNKDKNELNKICIQRKKGSGQKNDIDFFVKFLNRYDPDFRKENLNFSCSSHLIWADRRTKDGIKKRIIILQRHGQQKDTPLDPKAIEELVQACKDVVKEWGDACPPKKNLYS